MVVNIKLKRKIIAWGTLAIIVLLTLIFFELFKSKYILNINGDKEVYVDVNSTYLDAGAIAFKSSFLASNTKVKVVTNNPVDTSSIGKYVITYNVYQEEFKATQVRIVHVVDRTSPELNIVDEELSVCNNKEIPLLNYVALDNLDGNITQNVTKKILKDKVILSVSDKSGNETTKEIKIKNIFNESPVISLIGEENIYLKVADVYPEYGASAMDSCDGDISSKIKITSNVNTSVVGEYFVNYEVTDEANNTVNIKRNVYVKSILDEIIYQAHVGGTIYLTFDDGPGKYTEDILNTLDKYNIKATFFVTNQFPSFQHMIKKEYDSGHTVGVHTYSHLWSVYTSENDFMNDFNAINQIVYDQTGSYSKIFRFPGGSSNTISKKYNLGIMSVLAQKMLNDGYQYYDWNIDSTDTKRNNTKESIIANTTQALKGGNHYIILMHDIKSNTAEALANIIQYGKNLGYEFKPITGSSPVIHFKIAN